MAVGSKVTTFKNGDRVSVFFSFYFSFFLAIQLSIARSLASRARPSIFLQPLNSVFDLSLTFIETSPMYCRLDPDLTSVCRFFQGQYGAENSAKTTFQQYAVADAKLAAKVRAAIL